MKCPNCSAELKDNHKFCTECGAVTGQEEAKKTDAFDFGKFFTENKLYFGAGVAVLVVIIVLAGMVGSKSEDTQKNVSEVQKAPEKEEPKKMISIQLDPGVPIKNWPGELIKKIYTDELLKVQNTLMKNESQKNKEYAGHSIAKCTTEITLKTYPDFVVFNQMNQENKDKLIQDLSTIFEGCIKGFVQTHHKDANGDLVLKPREEKK